MSGWPSGLRRCVQVAVHLCGRGFESHFRQRNFFSHFFRFQNLNVRKGLSDFSMAERFNALRSVRSLLLSELGGRGSRVVYYIGSWLAWSRVRSQYH
ncbi:hypothetical protein TNCV_4362001 [Trichonephila clavipes]|nr:hypothetical protein TNCV_4362001 [Trichonephila clavipes]